MWNRIFTLVCFVLFLECPLLLNVAAESEALLSRASAWDCTSDDACSIDNSYCVDGYCECSAGYIFNTDMTACLLVATAYGDECTETLQCSTYLLSGAVCSDGVCICNDGFHYTRGRCYSSAGLGDACSADVNCYVWADTEASSCVDGVCVCSDGFYQREYRMCRRIGYAEGDECAIDLDCQFENGYCDTGTYTCALSTTDTTRYLESDFNETFVDDFYGVNRVERSLARVDENATVGTECVSDDNCTTLANSRCGSDGTCICNRAFFASSDLSTCVPEMGEDCTGDDDVVITNSLCRDNSTWSCGYSTVASINQRICRKSTKNYNWSCLHDEQCYIFGPDASCQSKRCLCDDGSHLVDDLKFCWVSRGISESCQADEDCYVEGLDLTCTNSICTCPNGTSPNSDSTTCKSDDAVLGDVCEEDDDCTITNSACIDLICACPDNYFVVDDYCGAGINATCSSDSDCIVANSTCNDSSLCDCATNFVATGTETCLPLSDYGEECESDLQCSSALSNTYCATVTTTSTDGSNSTETTSCQCESDYHYAYEFCYLKTALGGSCTTLGDCYVESGQEDVVCRKGICACSWDSSAVGTTSCSRTGSDATTFFLSTSLGLILLGVKVFLV